MSSPPPIPPIDALPAWVTRAHAGLRRLRARLRIGDTAWVFFVAAMAGLLAGLCSIGFHDLIAGAQWLFFGSADRAGPLSAVAGLSPLRVLLAPAVGGLLVGPLLYNFAREARGHGVPAVIRAVHERAGRISPVVALMKSIASALTLGSGGSLGREGPVVQIGASVGSAVGQLLDLSPRHLRMVVAGGAAGGLAAVFNAPLGGAFFALEVILGNFAMDAFGPVVVASVTATVASHALLGAHPVLAAPAVHVASPWALAVSVLLGLVCGGGAAGLTRGLATSTRLWDALALPSWAKPALGGLIVGALAITLTPRILGNGYETIDALISNRPLEAALALVLATKMVAIWISLSSGGSGGLFGPSLYLGAVLGALVGRAAATVLPVSPGALTLVGMGAFVAGTTHAPVSMVLMIFEMTDDYGVILPLLIATSVASVVARRLYPESVDTVIDSVRGTRFTWGHEGTALAAVRVADVVRAQSEAVVPASATLSVVLERFLRARTDVLAVVDERARYLGAILLDDVHGAPEVAATRRITLAVDALRADLPTLAPGDPLTRAVEAFQGVTCDALPVVDPATRSLVGFLDEKEIVTAYRTEVLRAELRSAVITDHDADRPRGDRLELPRGMELAHVPVPAWLAGKTLAGVDLRRRHGVLVLALRLRDASGLPRKVVPDPRAPLEPGAQLVILGPLEALDCMRRGVEPPPVAPEVADAVVTASQRLTRASGPS